MSVQYVEWRTLQTRGAVDPGPDEEVEGSLLVGTKSVISYTEGQCSYGEESVSIFPAFHDGKRCWVKRDVWCPAYGYSASGTQEYILPFEDGVKIFLAQGVFAFPIPQEVGK